MEVLDHSEYPNAVPLLPRVDRTGLASALALLLRTNVSLKEGRQGTEPSLRPSAVGPDRAADEFFDLYEEWLQARGRAHSCEAFVPGWNTITAAGRAALGWR